MQNSFLSEIPEVVIDLEGAEKFLVGIVSDGTNKKVVVRAAKNPNPHNTMFHVVMEQSLQKASWPHRAWCIGGGRCRVNIAEKTIMLWAQSGQFGVEPNRAQTARMIKDAHPDFTVLTPTIVEAIVMGLDVY